MHTYFEGLYSTDQLGVHDLQIFVEDCLWDAPEKVSSISPTVEPTILRKCRSRLHTFVGQYLSEISPSAALKEQKGGKTDKNIDRGSQRTTVSYIISPVH